jgi:hypothetical protein
MSAIISVQLDAVAALAAELAALAVALSEEARLCSSTGRSLEAALGGSEGRWAGGTGAGWTGLLDVLAARSGAVSATLSAAVEAYRTADTALTQRMGAGRPGLAAVAR